MIKVYRNTAPRAPRFKVARVPGSPVLLWIGPLFVRVGR